MRKTMAFTAAAIAMTLASYNGFAGDTKSSRSGNTEIIEQTEKGKIVSRIVYTYEGDKKIRGEYWIPADPKNKNDKKTNIFTGTAVAKHYERIITDAKIQDDSGIQVNIEKDGFTLSSVKTVAYNKSGLPEYVRFRGFSTYPVAGTFNLKTDWKYGYDANGKLISVVEKNMNVDSLLLNMGIENSTTIERDGRSRPLKVTRALGSIPPAMELTTYEYTADTANMKKTVYRQCSINATKLTTEPSLTITAEYEKNIPWDGMKKYKFEMGKTISAFSVYDEANKKQLLDGSKFKKMSFIEKGMFLKNIVTYYRNEQKGPKWRLGELPDVPEPFMIYNDFAWYN
ncbi:MAG TPA: hypothetical protein PKK43_11250, partial [Spirochaetota bacterium]|nr:hypothetical protein [Spirochaetota bacterium]